MPINVLCKVNTDSALGHTSSPYLDEIYAPMNNCSTWPQIGGVSIRPGTPRDLGRKARTVTRKGMLFWNPMIRTATASFGGRKSTLHKRIIGL